MVERDEVSLPNFSTPSSWSQFISNVFRNSTRLMICLSASNSVLSSLRAITIYYTSLYYTTSWAQVHGICSTNICSLFISMPILFILTTSARKSFHHFPHLSTHLPCLLTPCINNLKSFQLKNESPFSPTSPLPTASPIYCMKIYWELFSHCFYF